MKFKNDKLDWEKWCDIFQDIEYFSPLIEEIFQREGLGKINSVSNLTPGTNGVFKVNKYAVKIFVPDRVKPWDEDDFVNEKENIKRAIDLGINTPKLVAEGYIENRYIWNYLVFEYINGVEVKNVSTDLSVQDKIILARQVKKFVDTFNIVPKEDFDNHYIKERVISGDRWRGAKDKVRKQLEDFLNTIDLQKSVYVHGDLTAENVMIDDKDSVHIIDFADSTIAPYYYEYPPIVFDLFNYDKVMIKEFFKGKDKSETIEELYSGVLLHDFGGDIAKNLLVKYSNKKLEDIDSLEEIKDTISKIVD